MLRSRRLTTQKVVEEIRGWCARWIIIPFIVVYLMQLFGSFVLSAKSSFENIVEAVDSAAHDPQPCMVKVYSFYQRPHQRQEALQEIAIHQKLWRLAPEHFVGLVDTHTDSRRGFLVMEKMSGDLLDLIESTSLSDRTCLRLFQEACRAVSLCHQQGIAHMDIKPENILFQHDQEGKIALKLCDFGACAVLGKRGRCQGYRGTYMYAAPEVLQYETTRKAYRGKKADVYSLGVLLHVLLTGCWPYRTLERDELAQSRGFCVDTSLPEPVQRMVRQMMHRSPSKRPSLRRVLRWATKQQQAS